MALNWGKNPQVSEGFGRKTFCRVWQGCDNGENVVFRTYLKEGAGFGPR
jgi:hypothetical protein